MKARFLIATVIFWATAAQVQSQSPAGVNEMCSPTLLCKSGLYCVRVKPDDEYQWEYICCECDQDKLRGYTEKKEAACDPELTAGIAKNRAFNDAKASDGRVAVEEFDKLAENIKRCQEARLAREEACWDGGNSGHLKAITQLKEQNSNLGDDKKDWIEDKKVFYTTKSSYESALSNFKYKCPLSRTEDIQEDVEEMKDEFEDGKPIDCDDLEDYIEECQKCQDATEDFLDDCFNDDLDNMPEEYFKMSYNSENVWKQAKELLSKVNSASLCE